MRLQLSSLPALLIQHQAGDVRWVSGPKWNLSHVAAVGTPGRGCCPGVLDPRGREGGRDFVGRSSACAISTQETHLDLGEAKGRPSPSVPCP